MSTVQIPLGASIQAAVDANPAGTVFQLAAGTYRGEQFEPKSNDQFIGDPSGGTILSGATVVTNWTQSGGYWEASGLPSATGKGVAGNGSNPLSTDLNDLFVNNTLYTRVSSLSQVTSGKWYYDSSNGSAVISDNPTGQTVEYSVTPSMTQNNGSTGVVFQNLTTEKYATDAQSGPIDAGTGWQINNVTSTQNHGAGLQITANDVVQGGHFDNNGQIGIEGTSANNAQVLNAEVAFNNYAGYNPQWDAGGIKSGTTTNLTISGDNIHDNNGNGIWSDVGASAWTITNNTVSNNTLNGVQVELSHGPTSITGNTVSDNVGSGIYLSNSDGITVTGNTVTVNPSNAFNSLGAAIGGGIDVINNSGRGNDPSGVPYQSINDTVQNNTIIHSGDNTQDGIWAYQALPGNANDVFNGNTYDVTNANGTYWHFINSDYTWSALKQSNSYESSGTENVGQASAAASSASSASAPAASSSNVSIPASQASVTVSQSDISVVSTAGDHMVLISGTGDTVSLSGGNDTVTDKGNHNTFVLPVAGQGQDTFTNDIFQQDDQVDLRPALAATGWNGKASTLSHYLHVNQGAQGPSLSVAATSGGSGTTVATFGGSTIGNLSTLLAHAIT